ncbi:MAG: RNA polymerase sigma factor [Gemmataceae bacterium]|nr:RNA polymerase sigma factor [Gemmataceae bacterium]
MKRIIQHLCRLVSSESAEGMTDEQLLECFTAQQDEGAFAALLRRHGPMVLAACRRVLGDADDAFQATFLILIRKARSIGRPERLGNWLYGVAHRTALDARANRARRQARERQVAEMPAAEAPVDAVWQDLRPILDDELSRLPEKYRAPLVACYLQGKTKEEAARQLGWPEGTVSGRLARAKELVRSRLARRGLALTPAVVAAMLSTNAAPAAVPAALFDATLRVGILFAAGQGAAAGALSVQVTALTARVLRTMSLIRLKTAATILLATSLLVTGAGVLAYHTLAPKRDSGEQPGAQVERDAAWVEGRIQAWQPTEAERRFDEIGWSTTLLAAERLAKEHNRPVFLFVHNGSVVNARCDGTSTTMRAGPLTNPRVIDLLNRYFVPVYISNDEYHGKEFTQPGYTREGSAAPEEKREFKRIFEEAQQAKLNLRLTPVYVLSPEGRPIDTLRVAPAEKVENLARFLERTIEKLKPEEGKPVVAPIPQFAPPKAAPDALVLHLTARYLNRKGNEDVPFAPEEKGLGLTGDSWRALPSEEWIVFDRSECARLLPSGTVSAGTTWQIEKELSTRLLTNFYPQTANTDVARNVVVNQGLNARVISIQGDVARAWVGGTLTMKHYFGKTEDGNVVQAGIAGFIDFDPAHKRILRMRLVTDRASYGGGRKDKGEVTYDPPVPFGVAVRSIP